MKKIPISHIYEQSYFFTTRLRGQEIRYVSKPGLPDWDQVSPSEILLAEQITVAPDAHVLWLGCGHGAATIPLTHQNPKGETLLMDTHFLAVQMSTQTLHANHINNAYAHTGITVIPDRAEAFDTVAIDLPKGRGLARRWLTEAYTALCIGGHLYLAGANNQGIKSVIKDAEALFGQATILAYKKGNRIARLTKSQPRYPEPAWAREPGVAPGTWYEIEISPPQGPLHLYSLPGVFSFDKLDPGTHLLLTVIDISPGSQVLDLGCGYGVIGLISAQTSTAHVDLVDSNLFAVASAQKNLTHHGLSNASAFPSDALSSVIEQRYTHILTNPPFHTGRAVDYQVTNAFIQQSWHNLETGGQLMLVANKFLRYDHFMEGLFNSVRCVAESDRYHVLLAIKQKPIRKPLYM